MTVLRTLGNVRNFSRRLFDFLTTILNETRSTNETVKSLEHNLGFAKAGVDIPYQLQRIGEIVATNHLVSKRLASGSAALNDFCDEAAQLLLQHQRQLDAILSANKLLLERTHNVGRVVDRGIPALEQSLIHLTEMARRSASGRERIAAALDEQAKKLFKLEEIVKAQEVVLPSWHATPDSAAEIRSVLRLIAPRKASDSPKRRFGREFDGGYVMLDDFKGASTALSLGINDDVSWDIEIAHRGLDVFQFDHTISETPTAHERFHFNPLRIAAQPADGAVTLEEAFRLADIGGRSSAILKMDIEGDEWDVLDSVADDVLNRCNQIAVEFHHMERLMEPASLAQARRVFEKLARSFFLFHVHGNNCGNLVNVHNIVLPETLEMTFAKNDVYQSVHTQELFPQEVDMPNQPGRADFFLGSFHF